MSSTAYTIFRKRLIPDVDELILIHKDTSSAYQKLCCIDLVLGYLLY